MVTDLTTKNRVFLKVSYTRKGLQSGILLGSLGFQNGFYKCLKTQRTHKKLGKITTHTVNWKSTLKTKGIVFASQNHLSDLRLPQPKSPKTPPASLRGWKPPF